MVQALSFSPLAAYLNHYRTNKYMTHHHIRSHLISPQERQLHSTSTRAHLCYNSSFPSSLPFSPAQFHRHPSKWRTQRCLTRCKSSANNTNNEAQSGAEEVFTAPAILEQEQGQKKRRLVREAFPVTAYDAATRDLSDPGDQTETVDFDSAPLNPEHLGTINRLLRG